MKAGDDALSVGSASAVPALRRAKGAVWLAEDNSARFYIRDGAEVTGRRDQHKGWFVEYAATGPGCPAGPLTDPSTRKLVAHWGRLQVDWSNNTDFVMRLWQCQSTENAVTLEGTSRY